MMMADNGVVTGVAKLPRQPGDGERRRAGEVLDGVRGLSLPGAATSSWPRSWRPPIGAARVLTRTPVRAIALTDKGARVTLGSGKVLEAEHVLLTAPPSVWNKIAIDPVLPPSLAPQMGTNVKYLMSLKSPVWRRTELAPELLSDGPVSMTWHATDGQKGAGEALTAFSGGPAADQCREWTAATRDRNYLAELNKVYRGITASFVRARFMDWPSDPWTKASYSFPAPGQVTSQGPTLREGHRPAALRRRVHQLRVHGLHGRGAQLGRGRGEANRREGRDSQEECGLTIPDYQLPTPKGNRSNNRVKSATPSWFGRTFTPLVERLPLGVGSWELVRWELT